ncbi:MAG: hypothetical protein EKK55_16405 [Rhodocyclaceae bacterium]|nr:MAG: hypothetical protein EKK55_16405 [Rhodocyclaceae bacterium]
MDKPTVAALGLYFAVGVPTMIFEDQINALGQGKLDASVTRQPPPRGSVWADCDTRQWTPGRIIRVESGWGTGADIEAGRPLGTVVEVQTGERGYSLDQCAGLVCFGASKKAAGDAFAIVRAVSDGAQKADLCYLDTRKGIVEDRLRPSWNDFTIR